MPLTPEQRKTLQNAIDSGKIQPPGGTDSPYQPYGSSREKIPGATSQQVKYEMLRTARSRGLLPGSVFNDQIYQGGLGKLHYATQNLHKTLYGNRGAGAIPTGSGAGTQNAGMGGAEDSALRMPGSSANPRTLGRSPLEFNSSGELVNVHGRPAAPLTSYSEIPKRLAEPGPNGLGQSPMQTKGVMRQGFDLSIEKGKSVFQRTPEATQGMNLGQRARFAVGRLAGDIANDSSRNLYWRYNHPFAIAKSGFIKVAGGSKVGGAVASFAGVQALGQASGAFDLMNPTQAFRPKGMAAAYPTNASDQRQTGNPIKELAGRYIFGKGGRLLPYDQFKQERPDVPQWKYDQYKNYLKGGRDMPPGAFDLAEMGVIKGTAHGINGPEIRLAGTPVTPGAVAIGTGTALSVAGITRQIKTPQMAAPSPSSGIRSLAKPGALAIGAALIAGGSELSAAQREGASGARTALRTVISPFTTAIGGIAQPFQNAGHSIKNLTESFGSAITGQKGRTFKESIQLEATQRNESARFWDEAPKNITNAVAGAVGAPLRNLADNLGAAKDAITEKTFGKPRPNPTNFREAQAFRLAEKLGRQPTPDELSALPENGDGTLMRDNKGKVLLNNGGSGNQNFPKGPERPNTPLSSEDPMTGKPKPKTEKTPSRQSGGGMSDEGRLKIAKLTHDKGGSVDRTLITKLQTTDMTSGRKLQGDVYKADSTVKVAGVNAGAKMYSSDKQLEGTRYKADRTVDVATVNTKGRVQVAQIGFAGKALKDGQGGSVDRTNQNKLQIADMTTGRKAQTEFYKADQSYAGKVDSADVTGRYRVAQEGTRQDGQLNVARVRADGQMGSAGANASAKVDAARVSGELKLAGVRSQSSARLQQANIEAESKLKVARFSNAANQMKSFIQAETANSKALDNSRKSIFGGLK